jgi:hypothetical protein
VTMAPPSEEVASRRSRSRNIFLSLLLCQLIWIFPIAFFLLSSSSETVILPDTRSTNLYGPFKAFDDYELERLKKIDKDWSEFRNSIKETFNRKGLMQPWDNSCFIWIPDCYLLAKHQKILQVRMLHLSFTFPLFVFFSFAKQQQRISSFAKHLHKYCFIVQISGKYPRTF